MKDYFDLSVKNLRHRGIRSWLTLLGIFIGVMAVVSLISLGNGLQAAVGAQFGISSTEIITVQAGGLSSAGPPGTGVNNKLTRDDAEAIGRIASVDVAIPRILASGKIEYNDKVSFGMVGSVPDGEERKVVYDTIEVEADSGRMLKDGDVGDDVDLIVAKVKDKSLMDRAKEDIEKLMRQRRDVDVGKEDFSVSTPDAMLDTVNNILGGIQAFIIIIASISILVGAVGIVNTMTTSVLERRKE